MNRRWQLTVLPFSILAAILLTSFRGSLGAEPPINKADQQKIDAAIPAHAIAKPTKPRKLLIFGLNVGYPGHGSIRYANYAFAQMGQKTGAFTTVVSNDPAMFQPETLCQFDAVFFNNNVGNLFQEPELRQSLVDFIYSGGGMLGVHGTTVAFTRWPGAIEDWPEFGRMLGGRGANHKNSTEHVVVKLDDATNPINAPFEGASFDYRDEFFRVHGPYSRNRLRILLSIDTEKTDMTQGGFPRGRVERADNDYALAWIRNYGRGRVFYCTIAHNPYVFWDPKMLEFYLGAIQFALGDLPAPTTPSAQLTPARRAQEQLGWCLELGPVTGQSTTLFESIDLAARSKLSYLGAANSQRVSKTIAKPFGPRLNVDEMRDIHLRLDDAGVRLLSYSLTELPAQEDAARRVFQFAKGMGVEVILLNTLPESLDSLATLAKDFGIRVSSRDTPVTNNPPGKLAPRFRQLLGHDLALATLMAEDLGGIDLVRHTPNRVFTCVMPQLPVTTTDGVKMAPADALRRLATIMTPLTNPELQPVIIRVSPADMTPDTSANLAPSIELFNRVSLQLKPR